MESKQLSFLHDTSITQLHFFTTHQTHWQPLLLHTLPARSRRFSACYVKKVIIHGSDPIPHLKVRARTDLPISAPQHPRTARRQAMVARIEKTGCFRPASLSVTTLHRIGGRWHSEITVAGYGAAVSSRISKTPILQAVVCKNIRQAMVPFASYLGGPLYRSEHNYSRQTINTTPFYPITSFVRTFKYVL